MESFHYSSINKKKDISQNNILLNEYEEIISSSQLAIMLKEEEITNLKINLKEAKSQLNIYNSKEINMKRGHKNQNLVKKPKKLVFGWNDVITPYHVEDLSIESSENNLIQKMEIECIDEITIKGLDFQETI